MITILSPAKTFKTITGDCALDVDRLLFPEEMGCLLRILEAYSNQELGQLMKISEKVSTLNYNRYQNFLGNKEAVGTALGYFYGEAYKGLDVDGLSEEATAFASDHLMILSGLYGMIRASDRIKPYRLEMGTKLGTPKGNNLYEFWKQTLTDQMKHLLAATKGDRVLVNLASDEYSKALDLGQLKVDSRVLQVTFKVGKEGVYKMHSMQAKKARGMMARYILMHQINTIEALKNFDLDGYRWEETMSTDEEWVFVKD
ncbi:MAG: YaaA family protein [Cellulosilyticaceae bacterium]